MFLVGLIIGPIIGLLAGDFLAGSRPGGEWLAIGAVFFILVFVLFAPLFNPELKTALILSTPLGLLLSVTPESPSPESSG